MRAPTGWLLTDAGRTHLKNLGATGTALGGGPQEAGFRAGLDAIDTAEVRHFVEEALGAYETGLYRSAIVMTWVGAMAMLHRHVHAHYLAAFNSEAQRVDSRWRQARSVDDLGRMREADFLDRLVGLSIISKDVKAELRHCLNRRNSCGHPNSLKVGASTAAHHIEILLLNVFQRFQRSC